MTDQIIDTTSSTGIELPSDRRPQNLGDELQRWAPVFRKLLAETGVSEELFTTQIAQAVRNTKGLEDCDPRSILGAGLRCAQFGLAPNDGRNLAWIIPRNRQAMFQLGYGGILELARRAVPGIRFEGRAVFPNDVFEVDYGADQPLTHRPNLTDRGGAAIAWYVRAIFPDGTSQVQVLDREGAEYHRSFSKAPSGDMWAKSFDAAALKSCVVDLKRWLPATPQLAQAIAEDGETITIDEVAEAANVSEIRPNPEVSE